MRYEVRIDILDKEYIDVLIVALARQGYAPYYNEDDGCVGFSVAEEDLTALP